MVNRIFSDDKDERMPPACARQAAYGRRKGKAQGLDRGRGRVSAAVVVHRPRASRFAANLEDSEERDMGPQSDRSLRAGGAGATGPATGPGSRPPHARPASQPRSDWAAAVAGDGGGFRQRPLADGLREAGGPTAGVAALGRAAGALLARRRPLRRQQRHPHRRLPRDLELSRLGDQRLQPQHVVRSLHGPAVGGRPAARRRRRRADRHGLQSLQHHDQRRRRDRRRVPRVLRPRSHGNDRAGLDGPDRRLRGLPRPQVRPD